MGFLCLGIHVLRKPIPTPALPLKGREPNPRPLKEREPNPRPFEGREFVC